ncbi:MAG TPA: hypothetical protein VNZ52_09650 [Candidatus Thermoplasmatota archaeon]|nr:hypothetical protein [Candidatus Thermoplasmatota archaeon]
MASLTFLLKVALATLTVGLVGYVVYTAIVPSDDWEFFEGDGEGAIKVGETEGLDANATWTRSPGGGKVLSGLFTGGVPAGARVLLAFQTNVQMKLEIRIGPDNYHECDTQRPETRILNQSYGSIRIETRSTGCEFLTTVDSPIGAPRGATITWFTRAQAAPQEDWTLRFNARTVSPP